MVCILSTVLLSVGLSGGAQSTANSGVSQVFGSNMVLQRSIPAPVWGWAAPGRKVTVRIADRSADATADANGKWMVRLQPLPAGGPYKMRIDGPQPAITFSNVLVGDVWACSGQSNMELGIGGTNGAKMAISHALFPQIRLYTVPKRVAYEPQYGLARDTADLTGLWSVCTPKTIATGGWDGFSAAAYFFGRKLYQDLKVPIGLIHCSWKASLAEAWTSAEALDRLPDFSEALQKLRATKANPFTGKQDKYPYVMTVLYNGMIAPLVPYGIKGVIWYQGESNVSRAYQYRKLLPAMIKDWRTRWGEGDFPFLIVQLANYQKSEAAPKDDAWAELREAQLRTAQTVPGTALAVTIDIGDATDIHPKDKLNVGRRLALCAEAIAYGKRVEYSGPQVASVGPANGGTAIRVSFNHLGGGLIAKGKALTGFAIAGRDRRFVWAVARIQGDSVIVSCPNVAHPAAVRYAWQSNPGCNLSNQAGLPASPFRTDSWPGLTIDAGPMILRRPPDHPYRIQKITALAAASVTLLALATWALSRRLRAR